MAEMAVGMLPFLNQKCPNIWYVPLLQVEIKITSWFALIYSESV